MPEQRIHFEGLDMDSDLRLMQPGSYRYALNIRVGSPLKGNRGAIENMKGTTLLAFNLPAGTNIVIGADEDKVADAVDYFLYNSNGNHAIMRYQAKTNSIVKVFEWSGLNFHPDYRITGTAMQNGIRFWTDNYNPPRRINIARALAGEYEPMKATEKNFLNMLVPPPQYPLTAVREKDTTTFQNFIRRQSFQFTTRYQYTDGELSVLGPVSKLSSMARENVQGEQDANRITLTLPASEVVPRDVKKIEVLMRQGNTGRWKIVQTVTRASNGSFPAVFYFYNNGTGYALDDVAAAKPYESVPLLAGALDTADNRVFLGNYLEGYEQPSATLSLTAITADAANSGGARETSAFMLKRVVYHEGYDKFEANGQPYGTSFSLPAVGTTETRYWIQHTDGKYYRAVENTTEGLWVYNLEDVGQTGDQVLAGFVFPQAYDVQGSPVTMNGWRDDRTFVSEGVIGVRTVQDGPSAPSADTSRAFKSNSVYQVGVLYKDYGLRNAGLANGEQSIFIPALADTIEDVVTHIQWSLTGAGTEIPTWATHYHIVRTRNQSVSAFTQGMSADIGYAKKQEIEPTGFKFSKAYDLDYDYILVDIATLPSAGIGYTYQLGDYIRIYKGGNVYDLELVEQQGKYLLAKAIDMGEFTTNPNKHRFEVYTPYSQSENELFYEVGEAYAVTNAGLANRDYSVRTGTLAGDCYLTYRLYPEYGYMVSYDIANLENKLTSLGNGLYVEATSPNDKFASSWDNDLGRPTVKLTNAKQLRNKSGIRFSNPLMLGSQLNGLCEFEALNNYDLPLEHGTLVKLQHVGKNLLGLQETETYSIYVGQSEISDAMGQSLVSVSNKVLGSNRPLSGSFGCQHPETVVADKGQVFWLDMRNHTVVRYAGDGVTDIGAEGLLASFLKERCDAYKVTNYRLSAGFCPQQKEYILTLDDQNIAYGKETGRWHTFYDYSYRPECFSQAGGKVLFFTSGALYFPDTDSSYIASELHAVCNQDNAQVKLFQRLRLEGSHPWTAPVITTPDNHLSELIAEDFVTEEGQHYAEFLRDKNTPFCDYPLLEGDELRSYAVTVHLQQAATTPVTLLAVNIGFVYS